MTNRPSANFLYNRTQTMHTWLSRRSSNGSSPLVSNRNLAVCGDDTERALALYEWNIDLGTVLMCDIAHFEVALRNDLNHPFTAVNRVSHNERLFDPLEASLSPAAVVPTFSLCSARSVSKQRDGCTGTARIP